MQLHEENPTQAEHQNLVQQAQINKAHMSIQSQLQVRDENAILNHK